MAEWFKAAVLKTVVPCERDRGFESYSLRQDQRAAGSRQLVARAHRMGIQPPRE
jgi:hypothetical protein